MRRWGLPARAPDLPDAPSREHGEADELTDLIKSARETDPDVPVSTRMVRENAVTAGRTTGQPCSGPRVLTREAFVDMR